MFFVDNIFAIIVLCSVHVVRYNVVAGAAGPACRQGEARLAEFGKRIRQRRESLRMSVRELAARSKISASYVSAIESGRNPATGRPPEPSMAVVQRLCLALDLPYSFLAPAEADHSKAGCGNHMLIYRLDEGRGDLLGLLDKVLDEQVSQWICIADPREQEEVGEGVISWLWPFGALPYPDDYLVPDRIIPALEAKVKELSRRLSPEDYGLVIADCSAVMRWMVNPDAEVEFEERWADRSTEVLGRLLGRAPAVNICIYHHRDIEALATRIDVLDTILRLFTSHSRIVAIDRRGSVLAGPDAVTAILEDSRPAGVGSSAWRSLTAAAARGYANS